MSQTGIFYAIDYEQAVYSCLATIVEELCDYTVAQVTALKYIE